MLDELLNKGVVLGGDVVLGVAGVDLSSTCACRALLTAIDRWCRTSAATQTPSQPRPRRLSIT